MHRVARLRTVQFYAPVERPAAGGSIVRQWTGGTEPLGDDLLEGNAPNPQLPPDLLGACPREPQVGAMAAGSVGVPLDLDDRTWELQEPPRQGIEHRQQGPRHAPRAPGEPHRHPVRTEHVAVEVEAAVEVGATDEVDDGERRSPERLASGRRLALVE